ncbi:MAG: hypothetical protein GY818_23500 [Planctomycetaceae bacterium]|nr:hypothetical protein [Planctomycetaceae bacterium]
MSPVQNLAGQGLWANRLTYHLPQSNGFETLATARLSQTKNDQTAKGFSRDSLGPDLDGWSVFRSHSREREYSLFDLDSELYSTDSATQIMIADITQCLKSPE